MKLTAATLTRGTVFTFVKDYTFIGPRWAPRAPGIHFIVGEVSESGYTFSAFNTRTGRWDDMMAESWLFDMTKILGRIDAEES